MNKDMKEKIVNNYLLNPLLTRELVKYETGGILYQVTHENRHRIFLKYINYARNYPIYLMPRQYGRTYMTYEDLLYNNRRILDAKI